ncbi:MAG: asparagine synthase (glutamine-hydrolyzing) [Phycisphaerales bacterium]|nr:asparagine synthase (glutamine-hydrolyzing) [Phycisphaerales bacterium]
MCGIVGVISGDPIQQADVLAMRDALVHRGPDDAGIHETCCGTLGHTRLSVVDLSSRGHQPMTTPDGRFTIVYNGELYNDHDIRKELEGMGVRFESSCDTETVLQAVAVWGLEARHRLRGMYAMAVLDTYDRVCLLARDAMGVKPLYIAHISGRHAGRAMIFGSEIRSLLAHPKMRAEPDLVAMSAYLTTIRPEFSTRTLFAGIKSVSPGEWSLYSTDDHRLITSVSCWDHDGLGVETGTGDPHETRGVIEDSILKHLRTDVPMCALLSGGLDSSIIAKVAHEQLGELRTFCAGARTEGFDDDFSVASRMAQRLGTEHTEVVVDSVGFLNRWRCMVQETGLPLSTPNEVAIYEVCSALRASGYTVALSGEGADELFGGYESPMMQAQAFVDHIPDSDRVAGGFHLRSNAWVGDELKPALMRERWLTESGGDTELKAWYQDSYQQLRSESDESMQAHLKFHRRMNLPNLLRRLDSASMLSSVEGRTPYADLLVARYAESIPMSRKFVGGGGATRTKIALREAFADVLPADVVSRPKASFPLPFQEWMGGVGSVLARSEFARNYFQAEAIETVVGGVSQHWNLAWPMLNLVLWGEGWWGDPGFAERVFDEAGVRADPSGLNARAFA